ncbi:hypothetical protein GCM10011351_08670 [Paraliobacillus quinghaiensis]|uniref:Uncharacterized protein n=1 Tax=Paraliobacillus quinghaiensis TaxID=470815 RepID=A0A917TLE4_9BACI|nr:hypothetical protein [Paraliobacillus quinghaiensis]GGM25203.1 hypothetical protein GCM10011351_08670 [Paraliobacillus quinghaiensis]
MRYLTESEYALGSRFLFLSMAIVVIQKDLVTIEKETSIKIKEPYLELLQKMEKRAFLERKQLHKYMRKQNVKVISLEKNDTFSSYLYVCQGREEKRNYFNPTIRKKVEQIIRELMENTTTFSSQYLTNS